MIGYASHDTALAVSARRMSNLTAPGGHNGAALELDDGSWAAGLGYVCGQQDRRRGVLLPDGRHETAERAGGTWRLVAPLPGPRVHHLERGAELTAPLIWQRVPLRYAVILIWDRPSGSGPWIVVERGVRSAPRRDGYTDSISDGGIVRERHATEAAARKSAHALQLAAAERLRSVHYDVAHDAAVAMSKSGQQYGCNAAEG